jgi:hypothetical protein
LNPIFVKRLQVIEGALRSEKPHVPASVFPVATCLEGWQNFETNADYGRHLRAVLDSISKPVPVVAFKGPSREGRAAGVNSESLIP